jgi:hypothetical protein
LKVIWLIKIFFVIDFSILEDGVQLLEPNIYQQSGLILKIKVHDHIDNTRHKHQMYNSNHDLRKKNKTKTNQTNRPFVFMVICYAPKEHYD